MKDGGARRTISMTQSRPMRTLVPLTVQPASLKISSDSWIQELDADFFEDAHRRVVDGLDALFIQRFGRTVAIDRQAPGHLVKPKVVLRRVLPARPP